MTLADAMHVLEWAAKRSDHMAAEITPEAARLLLAEIERLRKIEDRHEDCQYEGLGENL